MKKGEVGYADLSPIAGSEQGGMRAAVIISADDSNSTVTVAPITSKCDNLETSAHVKIDGLKYGLSKNSAILLEHIKIIHENQFVRCTNCLDETDMIKLNDALFASLKV